MKNVNNKIYIIFKKNDDNNENSHLSNYTEI